MSTLRYQLDAHYIYMLMNTDFRGNQLKKNYNNIRVLKPQKLQNDPSPPPSSTFKHVRITFNMGTILKIIWLNYANTALPEELCHFSLRLVGDFASYFQRF